MRYFPFALILFCFVSCNKEIYPALKVKRVSLKKDSIFMASPKYSYFELANSEPHESRYWVFSKDSANYFRIFEDELNAFIEKHPNIKIENQHNFTNVEIEKCFKILSTANIDSLQKYLQSLNHHNLIASHKYAFLRVDFVLNKESGTSGLGPMGNFTPMGEFDLFFFILQGTELIYFSSMKRFASFFNRGYNSKRSKRAIKAFFRRI